MMRRNYGGYSRFSKQKIQSFFDIQTSNLSPTVLKFNAGGEEILRRLPQFFSGFKYYKVQNLKVVAVPQSTLPVDPTGLSYEEGEQFVDPRDQLTPGLIRITNGEDMRDFDATFSREEYNTMMLDPRWYKFMLQSGFKRSCSPRFWGIGTLHQNAWPGQIENLGYANLDGNLTTGHHATIESETAIEGGQIQYNLNEFANGGSNPDGIFQTGQRIPMGWMPTDGYELVLNTGGASRGFINTPPEINCVTVVLPKVYKTNYYYRVFVTETVLFKDPVVQQMSFNPVDFQLTPVISTQVHANPVPSSSQQTHNDGVQDN